MRTGGVLLSVAEFVDFLRGETVSEPNLSFICRLSFLFGNLMFATSGVETASNAAVAAGGGSPMLIPQRFVWPYGGRSVFLTGSFTRWTNHVAMTPVEGSPTEFQTVCSLVPGYHEYKFFVDGEWRHDESKPCACGNYGVVNTIFLTEETHYVQGIPNTPTPESGMDLDNEAFRRVVRVSDATCQPTPFILPQTDIQMSCHRVSEYLSTQAIYDLIPDSGKVIALDVELPVKQAFHILYEQGIPVAPLWDSRKGHFVGVLSPLDFILMLKELQSTRSVMSYEELEMHTISAWKEGKTQLDRQIGRISSEAPRGLIHLGPYHSLKDLALKILQNEVSTVPIILSSSEDSSHHQLFTLATLSEVLKCICRYFRNSLGLLPILQVPVCSLPLGSWFPAVGEVNRKPLAVLRSSDPLSSALNLLLQAQVSAIPVVDDSGSLIDIYSRSDITALAKGSAYEHINVDELTIDQALQFGHDVYNAQLEPSRCQMCLRTDPLFKVMECLAKPGVRRVVVVEPGSKRVLGVISLSDVFKLFLC